MARGLLPNFTRFFESSTIYTTNAEEESELNPWVQWVTVHSGMPHSDHGISHLGDGRCLEHACLGTVLSDAGIRVGICSSMNTNYERLSGYVIPDPWDTGGIAYPDWLQPFYRVVSDQVQENSRNGSIGKRDALHFALFLLRSGLRIQTAQKIAKQLWVDGRDAGYKWKRAALFDCIQYDLFRWLNRRFNISFATFFCNSTAHYQHYFWRNMEPSRFDVPPPDSDHPSLRTAVQFGYQAMDRLLEQFMVDYPDALLILCTALSQQPWTDTTKVTFRPREFNAFLQFAGIPPHITRVKPVMAEQFHLEFDSLEEARAGEQKLRDLTINGRKVMCSERDGTSLFAGCAINDPTLMDQFIVREADGHSQKFGSLFYMIHSMRSGHHHPDGVLWIRNGVHAMVEKKVPLTAIAPTILSHFRVQQPEYMCAPPLPI